MTIKTIFSHLTVYLRARWNTTIACNSLRNISRIVANEFILNDRIEISTLFLTKRSFWSFGSYKAHLHACRYTTVLWPNSSSSNICIQLHEPEEFVLATKGDFMKKKNSISCATKIITAPMTKAEEIVPAGLKINASRREFSSFWLGPQQPSRLYPAVGASHLHGTGILGISPAYTSIALKTHCTSTQRN